MAATVSTVLPSGNRPRHAELVGQPIGKSEVLLVSSRPHLFGFDFLKGCREILLVGLCQRSICRRK